MTNKAINRRSFLKGAAVGGGSALLPRLVARSHAQTQDAAPSERAFRFVHFGDTHVGADGGMPFVASDEGYPKALRHVHAIEDVPEFILHTGDIITDAFWASQDSAIKQWDIYKALMKEHCRLPVHYTLGNHDVNFGWGLGNAETRFPGKTMALEKMEMSSPYYSFDHGGWHFIVLDNTQRGGWNGFQILLDDTQFEWFANDLQVTDPATPVVVCSHAPILCVACFFEPPSQPHGNGLVISNDCVQMDVVKIHNLFRKHHNVKLCLSGHYHQVDHVQYLGVHHICGGAVCADYWRRPLPYRPEHEAGYGVVDLFKDGTFEYRFMDYGLVGFQDDPKRERYPWNKRI